MTLLTMINQAQSRLSLPRSSVAITSTDEAVQQLVSLANEEGEDLRDHPHWAWEAITKETTFTAVAAAVQTDSAAKPSDYHRIINDTFFNRSQQRRVTGPLTAEEWQAQQSLTTQLLTDAFRFRGGDLLLTPTPTAGDTYAYEYVSKNWCETSGGTEQSSWQNDTDVGILSEEIMILGIIWRYRKAKGFDYAEEFRNYQTRVEQAIMRDGGKRIIDFSYDASLIRNARRPSVVEGGWSI